MKLNGRRWAALMALASFAVPSPAPARTSVPPVDRKTLHLMMFVTPYEYGAKCDGHTDDSVALQRWLNAAGELVGLQLPNATCVFRTALARSTIDFPLMIYGMGPYQSVLKYTGANTTNDIISLGSSGTATFNNVFQNFRITSDTVMAGGAALHIKVFGNTYVDAVTFDGQQGKGYLYNGLWGDGVDSLYVTKVDARGRNDCYLVNGIAGNTAPNPKADFMLTGGGKIANCTIGLHVTGAMGGVVCGSMNIEHSNRNVVIDTEGVSEGNREFFFGHECGVDAALTGSNFDIDDALANSGVISIAGWTGTTPEDNVRVRHWNGKLSVSAPEITHATRDGIRLEDPNTYLSLSGATQDHDNGGYGVNCLNAMNLPRTIAAPFANGSGDFSSNCAIEPIPVNRGGTGDTGGPWTSYAMAITCSGGGSITGAIVEAHQQTIGKTVRVAAKIDLTSANVSLCAGPYLLASTPSNAAWSTSLSAANAAGNGWAIRANIAGGENTIKMAFFDFSSVIGTSNIIVLGGEYQSQ